MRRMNQSNVMDSDWATLQGTIDGEVVLPDLPVYQRVSKPFNARFHEVQPRAIVLCATPQDVSETILFLHRHGLENAIRCGGHCFAGNSSSSEVIINVTPMDSMSVS